MKLRLWLLALMAAVMALSAPSGAEVLSADNVQIVWKVSNRFRFFKDPAVFKAQELAWRQYGQHVAARNGSGEDSQMFYYNSSVLGIEHVLNDRRIPFTNILRTKFDWRGWAASAVDSACYNSKTRLHEACGGIDNYINPKSHVVELSLKPLTGASLIAEYECEWQVSGSDKIKAPCDQTVEAEIAWPEGSTVSVNVPGERPISLDIKVKDLLIVGLGDSFASGEGNPDVPVALAGDAVEDNLYPRRARNDDGGSARWLDEPCHRSLYSYQMRAALQAALENPHGAVTYLGYACSGASVDRGILGPQGYVEYSSDSNGNVTEQWGGKRDGQLTRFLREDCKDAPVQTSDGWTCPGNNFKRPVDYVFLSVGGNDIGFANLVAWTTLRGGVSARLAKFLGATLPAQDFINRSGKDLGEAYAKLARGLERAIPLPADGLAYDPARVVLTAYPDILADEKGNICQGQTDGGGPEDQYASNQSLDRFSSWLVVNQKKIEAAHDALGSLHLRMGQLAEANGWTFAARAYADKPFQGHGFCAQRKDRLDDPAEVLMTPCYGSAPRPTQTCLPGIFAKPEGWRPYNPETENYPYALRQRWVRTFNDANMVINQKVVDRYGAIDDKATAAVFAQTTGGMHPNAEGHASMADAMMMDLRESFTKLFAAE
jgi:lysophospholipase L1-like esterase